MTLVPWTPILRGPQLGKLGGYRKGAGGQGIGSRSMTAAAECPVTFGARSSWMGSRLLGWWGSSASQGTAYPETFPDFRMGGTLGRPGVPGLAYVLAALYGRPSRSPVRALQVFHKFSWFG